MSNSDHYTPDELADRLVSDAAAAGPIRSVCDLACGDGALLAAVRRAFPEAQLYGCELDPEAAQAARERLPGAVIETGDGLTYEPPDRPDLVLINPPYSMRYSPEVRKRWKLKGNCNLAVAFILRGAELCDRVSVLATNSIRSGASRRCGLARLLAEGWEIYRAWTDYDWPGRAAVTVVDVHLRRPAVTSPVSSRLDESVELEPARLRDNQGCSFIGSYVLGAGFILTPDGRAALIDKDATNADRIFPYIGGKEVNTHPTQDYHRYVIDFGSMSLERAGAWPDLLGIVRHKVKPERDKLRDNADGSRSKRLWWQYPRPRDDLYAAIAPLERCLVVSLVAKHLCFSFQPTDRIFAHSLCVFPFDAYTQFAVLQSRIHEPWAWLLSSTMRNAGINYSSSDCFQTFPFPQADPTSRFPELELIGKRLYEARAEFMVEHQIGLTQLYNRLHDLDDIDPGVVELRELHVATDNAVLDAYGWDNFRAPLYGADTERFNELVIERLMVLNSFRQKENNQ